MMQYRVLFKNHSKCGVLLKRLRHKEGLNQVELAEMIGITQANLGPVPKVIDELQNAFKKNLV